MAGFNLADLFELVADAPSKTARNKVRAKLKRAVKELGMLGAILNDFQSVEGDGKKYFDTPEYHVFWKTVEELDVPVYIHPSPVKPAIAEAFFKDHAAPLSGAPLGFDPEKREVSHEHLGRVTEVEQVLSRPSGTSGFEMQR